MPVMIHDESGEANQSIDNAAWSSRLAQVILVSLFLLNCYRAATQSFVHDEALTFEIYVDAPVRRLFEFYSTNHHFLFTLLMRLSSACFGNSEFALRIPSVLAGGLYFTSIYRLCRTAFGDAWLFLLSVLVMAGNPLVLDFMVAARGYGLALALFTYALLQVAYYQMPASVPASRWSLAKAGLAIGLSIAANNVLLLPSMGLTAALALLLWRRNRAMDGSRRSGLLVPAVTFIGSLLAVAYVFFLTSPFFKVRAEDFRDLRVVNDSATASLWDQIQCSLAHNAGLAGLNSHGAILEAVRWAIGFVLAPAAAFTVALFGWRMLRCAPRARALVTTEAPPPNSVLAAFLCSWSLIGAWLISVYLHYAFDVPLPRDRMGLYLAPLAGFSLAGAADILRRRRDLFHLAGEAFLVSTILVAAFYCWQVNWTQFYVWKYDADTRALLEHVAKRVESGKSQDGPGRLLGLRAKFQLLPHHEALDLDGACGSGAER